MKLALFSIMKFSLGLGLSGTLPAGHDLAEHVDYLNSYYETYGWEGSISKPMPLIPEAELWLRYGPFRTAFSYAFSRASGDLTHTTYGDAQYRFTESEAGARMQFVLNLEPLHVYAGPSFACARMAFDNSGDYRASSDVFTGWSVGAEGGLGVTIPLGKLSAGAELYGRYQPAALEGLWFDSDEGMLYESLGPVQGDRQARIATTGIGIRLLIGLGL